MAAKSSSKGASATAKHDGIPAPPAELVAALVASHDELLRFAHSADPVSAIMDECVRFAKDDWGMSLDDAIGLARRLRKDGSRSDDPPIYQRYAARMRTAGALPSGASTATKHAARRKLVATFEPILQHWRPLAEVMKQILATAGVLDKDDTWLEASTPPVWKPDGVLETHTSPAPVMALLRDGRIALACGQAIRILNTATRKCDAVIEGHTQQIVALAALSDGRLVSASAAGTDAIRIWDVATRTCVATMEPAQGAVRWLLGVSGAMFAACSTNGVVNLWNGDERKVHKALSTGGFTISHAGVDAVSGRVFCVSTDGQLRTFMAEGESTVTPVGIGASIMTHVGYLSGPRYILAGGDGCVRVWNVETRAVEVMMSAAGPAALPDVQRYAGGGLPMEGPDGAVTMLRGFCTQQYVACGHSNGVLRIWDLQAKECIARLEGHTAAICSIVAYGDRTLLTSATDGSVRLWQLHVDEIEDLTLHDFSSTAASASMDGRYL